MSKEFFNDLDDLEASQKIKVQFKKIFLHELDHVFTKIPSVNNVEECEHEYQSFVAKECANGLGALLPKCSSNSPFVPSIEPSASDNGVEPGNADVRAAQTAELDKSSSANQGKAPAVISARAAEIGEATPRSGNSVGGVPQPREQFSASEEVVVRRAADELFAPDRSGNDQIQRQANQLLSTKYSEIERQRTAEELTAGLDERLKALLSLKELLAVKLWLRR